MLKKFLATSLLTATLTGASLAQAGVQVTVDARPLMLDQPAVMQDGRVLVPLRGIFESLGADVVYLPSERSIKATRGQTQVELRLGSRNALINGQTSYLDVPASSFGGRTMVPLRFVSEALGADVDWQAATRTVAITSPSGTPQPPTGQHDQEPPAQETPQARLEIQSVIHSATGVLRPGDRLQVVMTGDPNGQAFFDVLGAFENVPMREVRPGRYEGTVTIPTNVEIRRGTVVGRLTGPGGQESQLEASRAISFGSGQANPGNPGDVSNVQPLPNSTVNQLRPQIHVQFDRPVRANSVRVILDNQDVTSLARVGPRQVRFVPVNNLFLGTHRVIVDALDQQGSSLRQDWSFNVNTNSGGYGVDTISLFNLSNGMTVDRVFMVQGQTAPYATVRVLSQPSRDLIPGYLGVRGRRIEMSGVADANGRFNIQMNASALPPGTVLQTTIESTDPSGRAQVPVHLNLTLR